MFLVANIRHFDVKMNIIGMKYPFCYNLLTKKVSGQVPDPVFYLTRPLLLGDFSTSPVLSC